MKLWIFSLLAGLLTFSSVAQDTNVTCLWQFQLPGGDSESSPALAPDGTIYQGTFHGVLQALTPEGKLKWQFKAGLEIKSSPAVASDGTIYFGSRDRKFYALTPAGKLKWFFPTGAWVDSSPAIAADGTVYFGSWDTNFYALNPDGQLKWQFASRGIVDSSPAIAADGTIYFGSHDKNFYALSPAGKLKWKFATGAAITASPAIGADGSIFISSTDGNFYALNPDGSERWRQHTGGYASSSPVLDETGNLYFAAAMQQWSLSPDGKVRGRFNTPYSSITVSGAALARGNVFLYTSAARGGLLTVDMKLLWEFPVSFILRNSPNVSPLGTIYFSAGNYFYAIQPVKEVAAAAKSSWPLWRANPQHTGRVAK
ncbi:MAG: PQQ-binding-like beta-propeller repeat protein [Verrucomicrobiae bacterium]